MLGEIGVVNQEHKVESRSEAPSAPAAMCAAEWVAGQGGAVNGKA